MNAETAARWLTAAPCATSIKASTARRDGGKKARTARAVSERALLTSLHGVLCAQGATAYDPAVLARLSSAVKSHVREIVRRAAKFSAHRASAGDAASSASSAAAASSAAIERRDVQIAVRSWGLNRVSQQEENAMARAQAARLNAKPLRRIKTVFGMQVPSESRSFLSEEYVVTVVEDEAGRRQGGGQAPPVTRHHQPQAAAAAAVRRSGGGGEASGARQRRGGQQQQRSKQQLAATAAAQQQAAARERRHSGGRQQQ